MCFLTSRALSAGRHTLAQRPAIFIQRESYSAAAAAGTNTFKAHVSYKPNPQTKPVNPNQKNKIPYKDRPLKQPFVPLPSKSAEQLGTMLGYIIRRTPSSQLPVYHKWMSGGNRVIVIIKKIDGDRSKLVQDLARDLEIKPVDIRLNPSTQHVEIKGNVYDKTLEWILKTGF
ncbi:mitochondrial large ribosomal subunit l49 [Fusarium austroafricanum]|uniref:Large ribosomal subunit protein mL49 n=1 Tax=Fusarium austroafricanum TaxID=2364996 RepID=A0A8H4KH95_9HYPO|nr:mitochondrial large ribosomal subunit l49 [Fusarium austroafricanum]